MGRTIHIWWIANDVLIGGYCLIAVLSTIIITIMAIIYVHTGDALFEIGSVINSFCVVIQFFNCNKLKKCGKTKRESINRQQMELEICEKTKNPQTTNEIIAEL